VETEHKSQKSEGPTDQSHYTGGQDLSQNDPLLQLCVCLLAKISVF